MQSPPYNAVRILGATSVSSSSLYPYDMDDMGLFDKTTLRVARIDSEHKQTSASMSCRNSSDQCYNHAARIVVGHTTLYISGVSRRFTADSLLPANTPGT